MKNCLISASDAWDLSKVISRNIPSQITNVKVTDERECLSSLNTEGYTRPCAWIIKAAEQYVFGEDKNMALIKVGEGCFASEWRKPDGKAVLAYANDKGELDASIVKKGTKALQFESLPVLGNKNDNFDTTSILILYVAMLMQKGDSLGDEAQEIMKNWKEASADEVKIRCAVKLSDLLQCAMEKGEIKFIINNGGIDMLSRMRVESKALSGELIRGRSEILMPGDVKQVKKVSTVGDLRAAYSFMIEEGDWTEEEKNLIPSFPDDYPVPAETDLILDWYLQSRNSRIPATQFLWRGATGCGKSKGCEIVAAILHRPFVRKTCHTNTDAESFLSTLIPAERETGTLPSFDDISLDPVYSYKMLTGKEKKDATPQECLEVYGKVSAAGAGKGTYFKRVDSEYVKALSRGWVCEIAEPSRIRDQGTLVSLNNYAEPGSIIHLLDGTIKVRHKDALVIYTDNVGYASCRSLDPSVIRRMAGIFETDNLDKDMVMKRLQYNTETTFPKPALELMYSIWNKVKAYSRENELEGDISPSDLECFVLRLSQVSPSETASCCKRTIISKATTDRDAQDDIMTSVVATDLSKLQEMIA